MTERLKPAWETMACGSRQESTMFLGIGVVSDVWPGGKGIYSPATLGEVHMKGLRVSGALALAMPSAALAGVTTTEIGTYRGECVAYVRSILPSLPRGLTYYGDKVKIINSSICRPGSAAIIKVASGPAAQYGHIAYVERCDRDGISIREANWRAGKITRRVATGGVSRAQRDLKISGYWTPKP
jgi:hypothetical protein